MKLPDTTLLQFFPSTSSDCVDLDCLSHDADFETLSIEKIESPLVTLEELNEICSPISILGCIKHVTSHRDICGIYGTAPGLMTYEHGNSVSSNFT